mgnify:CR=1 FL=1
MDPYIVFIVGCTLMAAGAIVIGKVMSRMGDKRNDAEEAEYLSRYSEAKRARKDVPVMLRKQAD